MIVPQVRFPFEIKHFSSDIFFIYLLFSHRPFRWRRYPRSPTSESVVPSSRSWAAWMGRPAGVDKCLLTEMFGNLYADTNYDFKYIMYARRFDPGRTIFLELIQLILENRHGYPGSGYYWNAMLRVPCAVPYLHVSGQLCGHLKQHFLGQLGLGRGQLLIRELAMRGQELAHLDKL